MTDQQAFDAAYWPAQPPAVQALQTISDQDARATAASKLASMGYLIDVPIMVWGWSPFLTMWMRQQYGYTWVPSALMPPVELAPGVSVPGAVPYDPLNPPAGAIIVTTIPLPPFVKPTPLPTPASQPTSLVGKDEGGGFFQAFAAAIGQLTDGEDYDKDPRGVFVYHQSESPFAPKTIVAYFTVKAAA